MTINIVVLGAGYAGLLAALRLARTTRGRGGAVTLVNPSADFADRIHLHERSVRPAKTRRIDQLAAAAGVRFAEGWARSLDLQARRVAVEASRPSIDQRSSADGRLEGGPPSAHLPFDHLVYALGSLTDLDLIPGLRDNALTFTPTHARQLRAAWPALAARGGRVLVVGGGLSGIEAAAEWAEAYPGLAVTLASSGALGPGLSPKAVTHIWRVLTRLGVNVREHTPIARLEPGLARSAAGDLAFDQCVWAGPLRVPTLAAESGLGVNARGQVMVDARLRACSHPFVWVAGDSAAPVVPVGAVPRQACATAMAMGAYLADSLTAELDGRDHPGFRLGYLAKNVSLGRRDGVIDWVYPDDRPRDRIWTGRLAAAYKTFVSQTVVWQQLTRERHWSGYYQRPHNPRDAHQPEQGGRRAGQFQST